MPTGKTLTRLGFCFLKSAARRKILPTAAGLSARSKGMICTEAIMINGFRPHRLTKQTGI